MARRARRTYQEAVSAVTAPKKEIVLEWETAIYARLSIENSKKDDNGESIDGQIAICQDYVDEHPYLHLAGTYVDNGWTGTNTNRPEFQRMLDDINAGKIKAIVIKDFSRFSRDYIEAGNLLENVFPFLGVRFISVADNYDSFETDGSAQSLLIPLKNLINSYYSKDISKKVSTAVHTKQLAGEHIPSMIPYGYRKSETQEYRFEPDPETAPIVTKIFDMRASGMPYNKIVAYLNANGVSSPGKLRYNRGQTTDKTYANALWSVAGIKQIFKNPTYLGHLVFGRMPTALYLGKPNYAYEPDQSKWRILENMHEPLVTQEIFDKVTEINQETKAAWENKHNEFQSSREANQPFFHNCLYCGDCNTLMIYHRYTTKRKGATGTYECGNHGRKLCVGTHSMPQDQIKNIVWNVLLDQLQLFCDYQKLIEALKSGIAKTQTQRDCKDEKQSLQLKMKSRQNKRERLYEDFTDGILSPEEYQFMKKKFDDEYQELSAQYNALLVLERKLKRTLSDENRWMLHMQSVQAAGELTHEVLEAMVDKILIYQVGKERRVEVRLKYQEDFMALKIAYEEVYGGEVQ